MAADILNSKREGKGIENFELALSAIPLCRAVQHFQLNRTIPQSFAVGTVHTPFARFKKKH